MATWDAAFKAAPAGSDNPKYGDDEIRSLKTEIQTREEHETVWDNSTQATGGVHRAGSAKAYYQATAPTQKPNTSDGALAAGDAGRLWVDSDTDEVYGYTGSAFNRTNRNFQCLDADPVSPIQGEVWMRTDIV